MKVLTFKKLANHWYLEIPHDTLDDIRLSEKTERCLTAIDSNKLGSVSIMLCEENCFLNDRSLQFSDDSMRRYFTTNDEFNMDIWIGERKFEISSSLYFLLEQTYDFSFHDTGYMIYIV